MPLELLERAKRFFSREKTYNPEAKEREIREQRIRLVQEGVKRKAGYVLDYRKSEAKPERVNQQLEASLRKRASTIAAAIIERADEKQKFEILAALQSLDPEKDESTKAIYDWLHFLSTRQNIPARNLQQAFFSQLQQENQPNILKKDHKLIKRAVAPSEELSAEEAVRILEGSSQKKQRKTSEAA